MALTKNTTQDSERQQGDDQRELERQLDAAGVEPDKQHVTEHPPQRLQLHRRAEDRREIGADEEHDDRRRHHVFDVLGEAGDKAAPRPEGGAGERVGAAGMRHRRAHLGEREGKAEIHDGDDDGGDQHAAPAARGEAEVPAGEVSRDDGGDAERPQREHAGMAPELAVFEIVDARAAIGDAAFVRSRPCSRSATISANLSDSPSMKQGSGPNAGLSGQNGCAGTPAQ